MDAVGPRARRSIERQQLLAVYGIAAAFTLLLGAMAWRSAPAWTPVAFAVFTVTLLATFVRPSFGAYLIVALTMLGDAVIWPWWPFTKNMSSSESILYVSDGIILNPLEVVMAVALLSFWLRHLADPDWRFTRGALFTPIVVFTGFVVLGFLRGAASGGDRRVAIFEARALFYLLVIYVLLSNVFKTREQYQRLVLVVASVVTVQCVFALQYYEDLPVEEKEVLERLGEHASSLHMGFVVVLLAALGLLRGPRRTRWAVLAMMPLIIPTFLISQRRAAMIATLVGVAVVTFITYFRRPRAFWFFAPITLVVGSAFVAATWNAQGSLGLVAQAVKSVIAPDSLSAEDQSSNLYREIEALNVFRTIRDDPILGVGFGRPFTVYYPMPDISFYEFWAYRPHHSVLWIWLKTGFMGFIAMLFLVGRGLQHGARSALTVPSRRDAVYVSTALAFVVMNLVFSYVDIGWDARTMVLLAVCLAICTEYERCSSERDDVERVRVDRYPEITG